MKKALETGQDLDGTLLQWAEDPDSFASKAEGLAKRWNVEGVVMELQGPETWTLPANTPSTGKVASIEEQLRSEIDRILPMDRESEANLARRIEFSRYLLADALEKEGLSERDLETRTGAGGPCEYLPTSVCKRWRELQAQRTEMVER
ncbi:MAG: hypothetical protein KDB61_14975, partial [Planctomycetes bacterium]|nr:hypothetical protein [Planctomycetota bacterium]